MAVKNSKSCKYVNFHIFNTADKKWQRVPKSGSGSKKHNKS